MMFDDNGSLFLNPNSQSASNNVVVLQDNDYTILEDVYPSNTIIELGTDTISHAYYAITFTEIASNSVSFVNYDKNGTANLIINPEADVEAHIEADTIIISGAVQGNLFARRQVIMYPPAVFKGTVTTPSLSIQEGVVFEGASNMPKA